MASSARGGVPVVHQDYIARIRYSNALPPPPNPPRLLDIPNTGLAGGQYTAPGFASRLAREQPLNIEADAELGMPLDLVGMPGVFDGDESSIQASLHPPPVHPRDRALLRPLAALGKPKFSDTGVSFLRRTEYISSYASSKTSRYDSTAKPQAGKAISRARRPLNVDRESPEFIKSQIGKGFDTVATILRNSRGVVHPSNRNIKLVGAYPVLPDLEAFGDFGGYIEVKFGKNPSHKEDKYDSRLETGILMPQPLTAEQVDAKLRDQAACEANKEQTTEKMDKHDYQFFLLPNSIQSENYKRKFDPNDLMADDETIYPETTNLNEFLDDVPADAEPVMGGIFKFMRVRDYETSYSLGGPEVKHDEALVLSIEDGDRPGRSKGAYYSPIVGRIGIEPQRQKNIAKKFGKNRDDHPDDKEASEGLNIAAINIRISKPSEEVAASRREYGEFPYGKPQEREVSQEGDEDGQHESDDEISAQL